MKKKKKSDYGYQIIHDWLNWRPLAVQVTLKLCRLCPQQRAAVTHQRKPTGTLVWYAHYHNRFNTHKTSIRMLSRGLPFPSMHEIKTISDLLKGQSVSHKFIHFELLVHVVLNQFGNTGDTLVSCVNERFIKWLHKMLIRNGAFFVSTWRCMKVRTGQGKNTECDSFAFSTTINVCESRAMR